MATAPSAERRRYLGARSGLAELCYEAADGDGFLALWLAAEWTAHFGNATPKAVRGWLKNPINQAGHSAERIAEIVLWPR